MLIDIIRITKPQFLDQVVHATFPKCDILHQSNLTNSIIEDEATVVSRAFWADSSIPDFSSTHNGYHSVWRKENRPPSTFSYPLQNLYMFHLRHELCSQVLTGKQLPFLSKIYCLNKFQRLHYSNHDILHQQELQLCM